MLFITVEDLYCLEFFWLDKHITQVTENCDGDDEQIRHKR
jgi:hypothetical protein